MWTSGKRHTCGPTQWPIQGGGPGGPGPPLRESLKKCLINAKFLLLPGFWRPGPPLLKISAYYCPPPLNHMGFRGPRKNSATTPSPPLNHIGFRGPRKNSATTPPPPTESHRFSGTTEKFCYYPPPLNRVGFRGPRKKFCYYPPSPLNRVDLALRTKGAPSLGKSWICD